MHTTSRKLGILGLAFSVTLLCACALPSVPPAGPPTADSPAQAVADLGHGIYVLSAARNNTTLIVGNDALVVIDNQFTSRFPRIWETIRAISPKPIRYVINTHYHNDHTGGNAEFRKQGIDVIAHRNVVTRLANPPLDPVSGHPVAPTPPEFLPNVAYTGDTSVVRIAGVEADLVHPPSGHTDGDTIVIFKSANVVATGDLTGTFYPNIDLGVGGGIDGVIAAVNLIIGLLDDNTKVIPGHGPVMSKSQVVAYRDMLKTARERIANAKYRGMTEREVVQANLLTDLDAQWKSATGPGALVSERFPGVVYRSLP